MVPVQFTNRRQLFCKSFRMFSERVINQLLAFLLRLHNFKKSKKKKKKTCNAIIDWTMNTLWIVRMELEWILAYGLYPRLVLRRSNFLSSLIDQSIWTSISKTLWNFIEIWQYFIKIQAYVVVAAMCHSK